MSDGRGLIIYTLSREIYGTMYLYIRELLCIDDKHTTLNGPQQDKRDGTEDS